MARSTPPWAPSTTVQKVKSWSYSRYGLYETCPFKFKCQNIDKLPQPPSPAMDRGSAIHKLAEDYTKGIIKKLPAELIKFKDEFAELRASKPGVEENWSFTKEWAQTRWDDWANCWLRVKVDAECRDDDTLYVIDHKTGKKYDDNKEQTELYAVTGFLVYPQVEKINTQLWYLDSGESTVVEYERDQLKPLMKSWEKKVMPMMNDTLFAPRPGNHCRWCHFSKSKGGPCKY